MSKCTLLPIGIKIGAWTIVGYEQIPDCKEPHSRYTRTQYRCRCDNGHERNVRVDTARKRMKHGGISCLQCEKAKHGLSYRHRKNLCQVWRNMVTRCTRPGYTGWSYYGANGVTVCDEWKDWPTFRDWAIADGYQPGLQIDRVDNSKSYCPDNCHWVTAMENANNKRNNRLLTAFGQTKTMSQWTRDSRCACCFATLWSRITRQHWHPERAIVTPSLRR